MAAVIDLLKRTVNISCNLEPIFGMQNCHARNQPRFAQVEYRGQTRYARILDCKPFINTCYLIFHRLELKYFHFAQSFLNAQQAAHQPQQSENWELDRSKIFEIKLFIVGQRHSKWLFSEADCSKNLEIKNWSSSSQHRYLHGFQSSHFICYQFGC